LQFVFISLDSVNSVVPGTHAQQLYIHLYSPEMLANNKKRKKYTKNKPFTKYPDHTSHTVESTDKIVFALYTLFTWYFEVEH